jgi:hypothetical protein
MIPVSNPFVQAPFVVVEFIIPNKWAAGGGDWGEVWKWKTSKDFQRLNVIGRLVTKVVKKHNKTYLVNWN